MTFNRSSGMDHNLLNETHPLSNSAPRGFWKLGIVILVSVLAGLLLFGGGTYVWAQQYEGRIPPRTSIDGIAVGGLDPETVRTDFQKRIDTILTNGIEIQVNGEQKELQLSTRTETALIDDVEFGLDETFAQLLNAHRENPLADTYQMIASFIRPTSMTLPITIQKERIQATILTLFPETELLSQNARFILTEENSELSIAVQAGTPGTEFQWEPFFEQFSYQLSQFETTPISLTVMDQAPRVSEQDALALVETAERALRSAPYELVYEESTYELSQDDLIAMLAPGEDQALTLLDEPLTLWIATFANDINQTTRDARLTIEDGRVTDFIESLDGRALNEAQLRADLIATITSPSIDTTDSIALVVDVTEPTTTTSDVNDLGIDQILGTGTSSYRGSPSNRRGNIQNGVDLLNGLLIPPGETFSLIRALAPFTYDNGYLPELVIKGDKIEAELGGGLCQIGTTTFRAVMNSGLEVVERRNHSLVVSYYNDPANGNPGTDATIYEPAPDFKFKNDTDHYVLFQAENLTDTQDLQFTFWGTTDGRQASYEPPVVSRWIPVGETRYIETTNLAPGVEQCQGSHIGADASFTYTVIQANGETEETLFESHYRPLPRICLVGVEEITTEEVVEDVTESSADTTLEETEATN